MWRSADKTWLLGTNSQQSVLQASDGQIIQAQGYTAYGNRQAIAGNQSVLGYNSERFDPVSGVTHLGNGYRAYHPVLMRFLAPDSLSPFGAGGINAYAYCQGDPINRSDPSGHLSWQAWLGIGLGIAGLVLAIATGGAAIAAAAAAAGGIMAAFSAASTTELAVGALGVVSDVTAIVSGALEDASPGASSILGWVSLATGLLGVGAALSGTKAGARMIGKVRGRLSKSIGYKKIDDLAEINISLANNPMEDLELLGANNSGFAFYDKGLSGKRLNIVAHGDIDKAADIGVMVLDGAPHSAAEFNTNYLSKMTAKNHNSIRLITCHSADGMENSFAANLKNLTKKSVEGYRGTVEGNRSIEHVYQDVMKNGIDNTRFLYAMNREFKIHDVNPHKFWKSPISWYEFNFQPEIFHP